MNYKKAELDSTQLEYLAVAEKLQAELIENGFMASRVEKEADSRIDFYVSFFDGEHDYIVKRNYNGHVYIIRKDWPRYENVSSSTQSEVSKKIQTSNNVKVITQKKLQRLLDETKAYHMELERLEEEAQEKINVFLETLKGLDVKYSREDYNNPKSKIKGGEVIKNGLEFSFTIGQDGYISKKIEKHYSVDNTLENFLKLSDNKLTN
jgi:hypothetical protein